MAGINGCVRAVRADLGFGERATRCLHRLAQNYRPPPRLTIIGAGAGRERIGNLTVWLIALTDFGDLAVLIPLSAAILIWLLRNSSRAAPRWILALGLCIGLTELLKIAFHACPPADNIIAQAVTRA